MLARERALEMALAEAAKHVHESGPNTGDRVRQYQAASSLGGTGWAWCNAFCDFCFAEAGRPLDELKRSAGVQLSRDLAQQHGWLVSTPKRGDLVCFQWDSGALDHIGFVVQVLPDGSIKTVEGNTGAAAGVGHAQGEGDGVYVKVRPRSVCAAFIRVPGDVPGPKPKAGYEQWARWVKGGRKGTRPNLPAKIPAAWWTKLGKSLKGTHDAHPPKPAPAH
jgi:CHAP domain-containing protein